MTTTNVIEVDWASANMMARALRDRIKEAAPKAKWLYGVPRGGWPVALLLSGMYGYKLADDHGMADVIIDDIVDSGRTREKWVKLHPRKPFLSLVDKTDKKSSIQGWLQFPWEEPGARDAEDNIVRLLSFLGENPRREGLVETPARVVKAWSEMTAGYTMRPALILKRDFDGAKYDEVCLCPNVEFFSTCEHHMLPFYGLAHVAYLPRKRVVGLSKLARLVDCFAKRLQIQEQMTRQIAEAVQEHLDPRGVAVVVQAKHLCMACRGVQKQRASFVTSTMLGTFRSVPSARAEFFKLLDLATKVEL